MDVGLCAADGRATLELPTDFDEFTPRARASAAGGREPEGPRPPRRAPRRDGRRGVQAEPLGVVALQRPGGARRADAPRRPARPVTPRPPPARPRCPGRRSRPSGSWRRRWPGSAAAGAGRWPAFEVGSEDEAAPGRLDGALLEAICARALGGARGAVFTPGPEARLLAALGLAHAAARPRRAAGRRRASRRSSPARPHAGAGPGPRRPGGARSLLRRRARCSRPRRGWLAARGRGSLLHGLDVAPLAVEATRAPARSSSPRRRRGAPGRRALRPLAAAPTSLLANPPFLRHERIPAAEKARAARAERPLAPGRPLGPPGGAGAAPGAGGGAGVAARPRHLPLGGAAPGRGARPRRLRGAAPVPRGGQLRRLGGHAARGLGGRAGPRTAPGAGGVGAAGRSSRTREVAALARGAGGARVRLLRARAAPRGAVPLGELCAVRFGLKSGCNAFFHLAAAGRRPLPLPAPRDGPAGATATPCRCSPACARRAPRAWPRRPACSSGRRGATGPRRALPVAGREGRRPPPAHLRRAHPLVAARRRPRPGAGALPGQDRRPGLRVRERRRPLRGQEVARPLPGRASPPGRWRSSSPPRRCGWRWRRAPGSSPAPRPSPTSTAASSPPPRSHAPRPLAAHEPDLRALWDALREDPVTTDLAATLARPAQRELDLLAGAVMGLRACRGGGAPAGAAGAGERPAPPRGGDPGGGGGGVKGWRELRPLPAPSSTPAPQRRSPALLGEAIR